LKSKIHFDPQNFDPKISQACQYIAYSWVRYLQAIPLTMSRHEKQCSINSTATTAAIASFSLILLFFHRSLDDSHLTFRCSHSLLHNFIFTHSVVSRRLRKKYEKSKTRNMGQFDIHFYSLFRLLTFISFADWCSQWVDWWWWCSACQIEVAFTLFIFNFILKSFADRALVFSGLC
jgi:hypothetical protein